MSPTEMNKIMEFMSMFLMDTVRFNKDNTLYNLVHPLLTQLPKEPTVKQFMTFMIAYKQTRNGSFPQLVLSQAAIYKPPKQTNNNNSNNNNNNNNNDNYQQFNYQTYRGRNRYRGRGNRGGYRGGYRGRRGGRGGYYTQSDLNRYHQQRVQQENDQSNKLKSLINTVLVETKKQNNNKKQ